LEIWTYFTFPFWRVKMGVSNLIVNSTGVNNQGTFAGTAWASATETRHDTFYGVNGSPISSQPKVVGGAAMYVKTSTATLSALDGVAVGQAANVASFGGGRVYRGFRNGVAVPISSGVSLTVSGTLAACSGGYCNYHSTNCSHGFVAGVKVMIGQSVGTSYGPNSLYSKVLGIQTITAAGTGHFTTDMPLTVPISGSITAPITAVPVDGAATFANINEGYYVIGRYCQQLAGKSNTALRNMAAPTNVRRSIHKREALRTTKTTTAIRAGYWNKFNNIWSTATTISNDITTVGADHAATVTPYSTTTPGELVIKSSRPKPFGSSDGMTYSAKHT